MSEFWDSLKKLFSKAEESSPSQPILHEVIARSTEEKADFERWKQTLVCRRLLDWLHDQYSIFQTLPDDIDEALDFLNTPSSKGFVIHFFKTRYNKREVVHFFDLLKEKVLATNYRPSLSDSRTYNRPNWVETVQKHYLKPRTNFEQGKTINQQYGNITIELLLRDDKVYNLRFRATSYNDRQYAPAKDFKELMQQLMH